MSPTLTHDELQRYMAIKMLAAGFPSNAHKVTVATIAMYMALLSDIPIESLEAAVLWCGAHYKFFPAVEEIREAALIKVNPPPLDIEAWAEVQDTELIGGWQLPEFSHPLITRTVELLEWYRIVRNRHQDAMRVEFIKAYNRVVAREAERAIAITDTEGAWESLSTLVSKMKALPGVAE